MILHKSCIGLGLAAVMFASTGAAIAGTACYCRTPTGARVEVGEVACLKSLKADGDLREAQCVLVLNNTAWKFSGNPCPLAGLRDKQDNRIALTMTPAR